MSEEEFWRGRGGWRDTLRETERDLGEDQDVDSAFGNKPLRSCLKSQASCLRVAGSRPRTGKAADESGMGQEWGMVLEPRGSRYARHAQAPQRAGHDQVIFFF